MPEFQTQFNKIVDNIQLQVGFQYPNKSGFRFNKKSYRFAGVRQRINLVFELQFYNKNSASIVKMYWTF